MQVWSSEGWSADPSKLLENGECSENIAKNGKLEQKGRFSVLCHLKATAMREKISFTNSEAHRTDEEDQFSPLFFCELFCIRLNFKTTYPRVRDQDTKGRVLDDEGHKST